MILAAALLATVLVQSAGPSRPPVPPSPHPPYFQQDVRYTIGASLDEPSGVLSGVARLAYRNNSPDTLREIYFHQYLNAFRPGSLWSADERREGIHRFADLPEPYNAFEHLGDVTVSGVRVAASYPNAPDSTIVRFALPRALAPGDSILVILPFEARPSAIPRRQGRQGRRFDFAQGYPKVCVYDRNGWQAHPLHLAGELYGEYGTYDVTLDLAEDQVVAASGVPVSGDPGWARANASGGPVTLQSDWYPEALRTTPYALRTSPGRKLVRFYAENIHHFAWSANPQYRYEEGRYKDIVLRTLYQPQDSATWGHGIVIQRLQRAMAWLDSIYGPYPYPQTIAVHRIEGGGTEFPMLVMNGGPEESLIFHEVGHIYTYGILGNNEWKEGFLDEGFTTFQTAWNFQRRGMGVPSVNVQQIILNLDLDGWSQPVATVAEDFYEFGIYSRMIYTKGQLFHEMVRYTVGEENFRRGLRLYYDRWKLKHVDEAAYRQAMEEVSGLDLRQLFTEWLHGTPLVDYSLGSVQRWQLDNGQWRTEITVDRRGNGVMPVDIAVPAGDSIYTVRVSGTQPSERVQLTTPVRSGRVELDLARQTMDWNYLNNREGTGPLRLLGPVGPKSVNRFGWSGSQPARRDRRVSNLMPLAWYNDAGGLQAGVQWRSNYLGRFDQNALQLTYGARGSHRLNGWLTLRNPTWLRVPRARLGGDVFLVEGRRGGRVWVNTDRSAHLTFGPRLTVGVEFSHINVSDTAYVDRARWSDQAVTEIGGFVARRWSGPVQATDARITTAFGLAGEPARGGLGAAHTYGRATFDLRHQHTVGRFELRGRGYLGGMLRNDSVGAPLQRSLFVAGADPYETFANPFLRSAGALFVRPDVNYSAPGGGGLRAYHTGLAAQWMATLSAEVVFTAFRKPRRHAFTSLSLAAFGDAGVLGGKLNTFSAPPPSSLGDAGVGVRATHRIGPTNFTTRVDLPLFVSNPALAAGGKPGDGRAKLRFVWSLEEAF